VRQEGIPPKTAPVEIRNQQVGNVPDVIDKHTGSNTCAGVGGGKPDFQRVGV
jgi:hypothetical protein